MKAEERKHLKENELAERLGRYWRTISSGSTTNTIIWGIILVGLALAIGWRYYSRTALNTRSAEWSEIEQAGRTSDLDQIIKDRPGTPVARIARFHLNRAKTYDALSRVASPMSDERVKAADELVNVRDAYAELAKDAGLQPELIQESLMGVAKAEEVLAGIPKIDKPEEPRGSLDAAQKAYEDLAKRYPESYFGKQAAARAKDIDEHKIQIRAFYNQLMEAHGKQALIVPALPAPPSPDAPKPVDPKDVPAVKPLEDKPAPPPAPPADGKETPTEPKPKAP